MKWKKLCFVTAVFDQSPRALGGKRELTATREYLSKESLLAKRGESDLKRGKGPSGRVERQESAKNLADEREFLIPKIGEIKQRRGNKDNNEEGTMQVPEWRRRRGSANRKTKISVSSMSLG